MRAVADARPVGSSPTESRNEDRLEQVVHGHNLPTLVRQVRVGGERPIGRCDFRASELPLVVEVNSFTFHGTPSDQAADERRYAALIGAGFTVAVVWETDLWSHPGNTVDTVRTAQRLAVRGETTVVHSASCPWPHDPQRHVVPLWTPDLRG